MTDVVRDKATRSLEQTVEIDARPEDVWRALTDGGELERWFPLEARVTPGEGGRVWMSWKNEYTGESKILGWDPNRHLRTTWGEMDGQTEGIQVTDYFLESDGQRTKVRVVTSGFPTDPSWDSWFEGTRRGWQFELRGLKEYLERHRGQPRHVAYVRCRTTLSPEAAWAEIAPILESATASGTRFIEDPPYQVAGVRADGSVWRVSVDPAMGRDDARDITLWLALYGDQHSEAEHQAGRWRADLQRILPNGQML